VLLAVALLFAQAGAFFVAFLALVALLIYAATQRQGAPSGRVVGVTPDGRPIIVKSSAAKIPSTIKVKVNPSWGDTTSYEDLSSTAGDMATIFFRTIHRLFSGGEKK